MTVTPLQPWRRNASDVTVLELTEPRDLHRAEAWLRGHCADVVRYHPTIGDAVRFRQRAGRWQTAALGQRLVRHIKTGRFEVLDDHDFLADHTRAGGRADLETLIDNTVDNTEGEAS